MNKKVLKQIWNSKWLYVMLFFVMAYYIVFKYVPMYGITIAFKDYNVFKGVLNLKIINYLTPILHHHQLICSKSFDILQLQHFYLKI